MNAFHPFSPVDIRILPKVEGLCAVRTLLKGQKHNLLALAPRSLCTGLGLAAFFTALQSDGHAVQLVADIPANPSVEDVTDLLSQLHQKQFQPTILLAIGGGSCMDLAKAVSALFHHPGLKQPGADDIRLAIEHKTYTGAQAYVPLIAMPTTSGTGSEVTKWATIWDASNRRKLSLEDERCFARAAVLIPEWTAGMPPALTVSTGLDAVSHAAEAFWAKTRTPLSQALALCAIQKARDFLPQALRTPDSLAAREGMCIASLLAGLSFSLTRTTACHSISYPLTLLFGIPHGFAAALSLPSVMERNRAAVPEIGQIDAIFAPDGGLHAWMESLCKDIHPLTLSAFGLLRENLPSIVELTFTAGRMDNNPVLFSKSEVLDILTECF